MNFENMELWWIIYPYSKGNYAAPFRFHSTKAELEKNINLLFKVRNQFVKETGIANLWDMVQVSAHDNRAIYEGYEKEFHYPDSTGIPTDAEYENILKRLG